jgi:hypothetical protein
MRAARVVAVFKQVNSGLAGTAMDVARLPGIEIPVDRRRTPQAFARPSAPTTSFISSPPGTAAAGSFICIRLSEYPSLNEAAP